MNSECFIQQNLAYKLSFFFGLKPLYGPVCPSLNHRLNSNFFLFVFLPQIIQNNVYRTWIGVEVLFIQSQLKAVYYLQKLIFIVSLAVCLSYLFALHSLPQYRRFYEPICPSVCMSLYVHISIYLLIFYIKLINLIFYSTLFAS